jgi:hypothetical protein
MENGKFMLNQATELRAGDVLLGVGTVTEAVRRAGWVRITAQPEEGTPICFDLPSSIVVETDRPVPVQPKQDLPWNNKTTSAPKRKVNPTPIPVTLVPVNPSTSQPGSGIGGSTVRLVTLDPERLGD